MPKGTPPMEGMWQQRANGELVQVMPHKSNDSREDATKAKSQQIKPTRSPSFRIKPSRKRSCATEASSASAPAQGPYNIYVHGRPPTLWKDPRYTEMFGSRRKYEHFVHGVDRKRGGLRVKGYKLPKCLWPEHQPKV